MRRRGSPSAASHARFRAGWLAGLLLLAACEPDPQVTRDELVGALPANSYVAVAMGEGAPQQAVMGADAVNFFGLGEIGILGRQGPGLADLIRNHDLALAMLAVDDRLTSTGERERRRARARGRRGLAEDSAAVWYLRRRDNALTELPSDAELGKLEARHEGRTLVLEPRDWPKGVPRIDARLAGQTWFKETFAGLRGSGGLTLFADLRELRQQFSARQEQWIGEAIRRIPGFASVLSLGIRVRGDEEFGYDLYGFVRMARTPVGFAKALEIEPAALALPQVLRDAGYANWAVQRLEAGVIADSIKLALGMTGLGIFGPNPGMIAQRFGGFLFRKDFWESCGPEWGIGVEDSGDGFVIVNRLRDRAALMTVLRDLAAKPPMRSSIDIERSGNVDLVSAEFFGQKFYACVGPRVAALELRTRRRGSRDGVGPKLRKLVEAAELVDFDAKAAGFAKAPKALNGVFEIQSKFLRMRGSKRRLRLWTEHRPRGIRVQGRLDQR